MSLFLSNDAGIVMNSCQQECPLCGGSTNFEFPFYVHEQAWPDFMTYALETNFGGFTCKHCKTYVCSTCPFIFDSSRLQLLIFIVHGGDNVEIERNFKRHLEEACSYLPNTLVQEIKNKPYTFVDGCKGWREFLKCLHDIEIDEQSPYKEDSAFATLFGYIYGKLFFYYPDQFNIRFATKGFMDAAENYSSGGQPELAYEVLLEATKVVGATNQWLVQKLGEAALHLGKFEEAKVWLSKAILLQHKWLTPTLSFMDATPPRAEEERQDSALPHAAPALGRGSVTASRHVVTGVFPPTHDYGLWYFPELHLRVIPNEYSSLDKLMIIYGIALGELEHSFSQNDGKGTLHAMGSRYHLLHTCIEYLRLAQKMELAPVVEQFWMEYALSRWRIPRNFMDAATITDPEPRNNLSKKFGDDMGHIGKELKERRKVEKNSIEAFFLGNALKALTKLIEKFIDSCPREEQGGLMRIRFQAEIDILADGEGQWKVSINNPPH